MILSNQSYFFYPHITTDVRKNPLSEDDPSFKNLKFLILIMQIIHLFNMQWIISSLGPNQTHLIKDMYVICGGMLIFVTITIKFIWIMRNETSLDSAWHYDIAQDG